MQSAKAFVIDQQDGSVVSGFREFDHGQPEAGDVIIKVAYSSINYKDALAATGKGKIIRKFPCVGGIDMAGIVVDSRDDRFKPGDEVIATSYDLGVARHGGYASFSHVPADWVVPLPAGLTLHDSMALGTAGFTAALGVLRMEENGLMPGAGEVLVTGATGGVGSIAINILSGLGYDVVALTGKAHESTYLESLGARRVMLRDELDLASIRPLGKTLWAGAIDNLGGDVLAWVASNMQYGGSIASIGMASAMSLNTTVAPFILRGVNLLGIDSSATPMALRKRVWDRLAKDMKPALLDQMTRVIDFDALPASFDAYVKGSARGRIVVRIAGDE